MGTMVTDFLRSAAGGAAVALTALAGCQSLSPDEDDDDPPRQRLTLSATANTQASLIATIPGSPPETVLTCGPSAGGATGPCTADVPEGSRIKLSTTTSSGSHVFMGWDGEGCAGLARCEIVMDRPRSVTATFGPSSDATFNLAIEAAYLTQGIQNLDGTVELITGRDAYVRVFVVANQPNTSRPWVRIQLYHGETEVLNQIMDAGSDGVELAPNQQNLNRSWNMYVPQELVVPGLRLLAEVDPHGQVPDYLETDNRFPLEGPPLPVAVRALPPFSLRLVPILQSTNGLVGTVSPTNPSSYLLNLREWLPIGALTTTVRATYTTSLPPLQAVDGNGSWQRLLNELLAVQKADGPGGHYYYGVVKLPYTIGLAGTGLVPPGPGSKTRLALGTDHEQFRAATLAHELGHTMGRRHSPCGISQDLDLQYPYGDGTIGGEGGLDLLPLAARPASSYDFMGYCAPKWVSDYTWSRLLQWRVEVAAAAPGFAAATNSDDGLLVWGRMDRNGVVLEPAFRVAPTGETLAGGRWQVEGRDAAGSVLFSRSFEPDRIADLPDPSARQFAFVLPVEAALLERLSHLRVSGPGGSAERRTRNGPIEPSQAAPSSPLRPGVRRLTWDGEHYPMALVRDADTGEILSFARGGGIDLLSHTGRFEVQLSDGVRAVKGRTGEDRSRREEPRM